MTAAVTRAAPAATPPRFFAAALAGFVTVRTVLPELSSSADGLPASPPMSTPGSEATSVCCRRTGLAFAAVWRFGFLAGCSSGSAASGAIAAVCVPSAKPSSSASAAIGSSFGTVASTENASSGGAISSRLKDRARGRVVAGQLDRMLGADRDLLDQFGSGRAATTSVLGGVTAGALSCAASGASAATLAAGFGLHELWRRSALRREAGDPPPWQAPGRRDNRRRWRSPRRRRPPWRQRPTGSQSIAPCRPAAARPCWELCFSALPRRRPSGDSSRPTLHASPHPRVHTLFRIVAELGQ